VTLAPESPMRACLAVLGRAAVVGHHYDRKWAPSITLSDVYARVRAGEAG
jgi:hypothetical protein